MGVAANLLRVTNYFYQIKSNVSLEIITHIMGGARNVAHQPKDGSRRFCVACRLYALSSFPGIFHACAH